MKRPRGCLIIYGEAHPAQTVWVRNGETVEHAVWKAAHEKPDKPRKCQCPQMNVAGEPQPRKPRM